MIQIVEYDPRWPSLYEALAGRLQLAFGDLALSIDHIGSTSVPGLAAKPVIDAQVSVATFDGVAEALVSAGLELASYTHDHRPAGSALPEEQLEKRTASTRAPFKANVHVRVAGNFNQRYPLLFRDYLRATPEAAAAYADIKRNLARIVEDDIEAYYDVKDPVCDLIIAAAEMWASQTGWRPTPHILAAESAGRS